MAETAAKKADVKAQEPVKDDTAVVTARDGSEVYVPVVAPPEADVRDQFSNNSDWPLFQKGEFVRAKQLPAEEGSDERKYQVFDQDGKESQVAADEFEAEWLIVKGPHKQEF